MIFGAMSAIEAAPVPKGAVGWRAYRVIKFHPETPRPAHAGATVLDHADVTRVYEKARRSFPRPPANPAPAGRVQIGFEVRPR
jgi:hypothetical protein